MIITIEEVRTEKLTYYLSKLEGKKLFIKERLQLKRVLWKSLNMLKMKNVEF